MEAVAMKLARLVGLVFTTVLAMNLVAAAVAAAAGPEFSPGTLDKFSTSDEFTLENALTSAVNCESNSATGEVTGVKTVGSLIITFSGCTSPEGGGCQVHSVGAGTGKVLWNALNVELGSVKTSEAESGVGLLLKPASGTAFTTIEGSCVAVNPAPVTGDVVAEVLPINAKVLGFSWWINGRRGVQKIKKINLLGKEESPSLLAFGAVQASLNGNISPRFAVDIEVVIP
jgi:hypothetical protein